MGFMEEILDEQFEIIPNISPSDQIMTHYKTANATVYGLKLKLMLWTSLLFLYFASAIFLGTS